MKEDHDHAKELARILHAIPSVSVNPDEVETNIIFFEMKEAMIFTFVKIARSFEPGRTSLPAVKCMCCSERVPSNIVGLLGLIVKKSNIHELFPPNPPKVLEEVRN